MKKVSRIIGNMFFGKKKFQRIFGFIYKVSLKGMNFGASEASDSGEKNVLQLIHKEIKGHTAIVFDVGANKGQYANLVNSVFQGNAKIYSFEPGKFTYSKLVENVRKIMNIQTFNFGLGDHDSEETLNYDIQGSGLASIYSRKLDHININFDKSEMITIKTIDDFCDSNKVNNIDLLKIDVEGYEMSVLLGAQKMIQGNNVKYIQFEFGGANIDSRTYFQDFYLLLKDKYNIYRILQDGLLVIDNYSELQEIFTTVNYLAIHK